MKLFNCQNCGQPLYFENRHCPSCGLRLGYLPLQASVTALTPAGDLWHTPLAAGAFRLCANAAHDVCNWLLPADSGDALCAACRHNRTIPDLSVWGNLDNWRKVEVAKQRLFYTLLRLGLPLATKAERNDGLAFDFLVAVGAPVMTGHTDGVITINLAEADDAEREKTRGQMGEPYRTLLGHFRHEIAHYYWDRLVLDQPVLADFRSAFGDEREDYAAALQRHYAQGAPSDWPERFVTAYASAHPWEDFAETWAHYFHMVDTLETAAAFGLALAPHTTAPLDARIDFDPHLAELPRLIDAWLPLSFAANSLNRSMGLADLYPFVPTPAVIVKLAFVHDLIHRGRARDDTTTTLQAVAAGLRRKVGEPME
jgi:hypothetical protein